ncbi:MAG: purine-nucleoside phosphorylase [Alphaproteobacteria bacterium]|nr:purine-nucleoside phosphorylase [Alphaproteobacteria bacterium]
MTTPHINAKTGDFAETVLLPGDPLRAKFIAENFLENPVEITNVRNMLGFTGNYQGKKVSVMGSGMGIPSCSIYSKELITEYGVKNIIRVGSAGGLKGTKLRDVIIVNGASTDSGVNRQRMGGFDYAATADFGLTLKAYNAAKSLNISAKVGQCFSADLFYTPNFELFATMEKMKILCVEMEAAGLFGVAAEFGAKALALLTISDHIRTGESLSSDDRQKTFTDMMKIALSCA